ncbi:MAG: hypothetical protein Q7K42_05120, partial [Candidatus Diapherotrites archaeon]|nr:hypothetical protein [Candidatus Diapherotrites archaeon]
MPKPLMLKKRAKRILEYGVESRHKNIEETKVLKRIKKTAERNSRKTVYFGISSDFDSQRTGIRSGKSLRVVYRKGLLEHNLVKIKPSSIDEIHIHMVPDTIEFENPQGEKQMEKVFADLERILAPGGKLYMSGQTLPYNKGERMHFTPFVQRGFSEGIHQLFQKFKVRSFFSLPQERAHEQRKSIIETPEGKLEIDFGTGLIKGIPSPVKKDYLNSRDPTFERREKIYDFLSKYF